MSRDERPYRQTSLSAAVLAIGLTGVALCAGLVLAERGGAIAFGLGIGFAVLVLLVHSVELRIDRQALEVRMGNGWRRHRIDLETIADWRISTAERTWGVGRADGGRRVYGLGATDRLHLETDAGEVIVGLDDAADAAAALRVMRRPIDGEAEASTERPDEEPGT